MLPALYLPGEHTIEMRSIVEQRLDKKNTGDCRSPKCQKKWPYSFLRESEENGHTNGRVVKHPYHEGSLTVFLALSVGTRPKPNHRIWTILNATDNFFAASKPVDEWWNSFFKPARVKSLTVVQLLQEISMVFLQNSFCISFANSSGCNSTRSGSKAGPFRDDTQEKER